VPTDREGWGRLARRLGVKVIHIAERDTRSRLSRRRSASSSTLVDRRLRLRGRPAAEMGWAAREGAAGDGRRHTFGSDAAIYLNRPGLLTRVRTWTPLEGPFHGFIITHNESISIADYFTLGDGRKVVYGRRCTTLPSVRPGDQSMHEIAGKNCTSRSASADRGRDRLGRDELACC